MAENTMKLEVITPERSFYTGDVTFVELNTTEGEVGIYARHIPMTMIIAPGVLTITEEDGTKKKAALLKGFVEVTETTMSILAEVAEWPEDIFFHDLFDAGLADDIRQLVFFDIRRALDAVHALFTV